MYEIYSSTVYTLELHQFSMRCSHIGLAIIPTGISGLTGPPPPPPTTPSHTTRRHATQRSDSKATVFVSHIAHHITDQELREHFQVISRYCYLVHLSQSKADPSLNHILYKRALAHHPLNQQLWKNYLNYIVSSWLCVIYIKSY